MSNYHITPPDGTSWLANDRGDIYLYERMEKGYAVETLFEDEFRERYALGYVEGAVTKKNLKPKKK